MPQIPGICKLCFCVDKYGRISETQLLEEPTERLLFLSLAVLLSYTDEKEAGVKLKRSDLHYCTKHFAYFADKLIDISGMKSDGEMTDIGLRIIQTMATTLTEVYMEPNIFKHSIRLFLCKFSEKGREIHRLNMSCVCPEYTVLKPADKQWCRCLECGTRHPVMFPKQFEKYHEKVAYGIYAGPHCANLMNLEQVHAVARLPRIPLCRRHQEDHVLALRKFHFDLLIEENFEKFQEDMKTAYGKGVVDPLKMVNCFMNKYETNSKPPDPLRCQFCRNTDTNVSYDHFFGKAAHKNCFIKCAQQIQWELRTYDLSGNPKVIVPTPEELELKKGEELEKALELMKVRFGYKELTVHQMRVRLLVLFARYWYHDREVDAKTAKELERFPKVEIKPVSRPDPDAVWESYGIDTSG